MSIAIPDSMITINGASVSTTTAVKLLLCSPLYISCITTTVNAEATENGKNDYFGLGLLKFLLVTVIPGVACIIIVGTIIYCCCFRNKTPDESVEMNNVSITPKVDPEIPMTEDVSGASLLQVPTTSFSSAGGVTDKPTTDEASDKEDNITDDKKDGGDNELQEILSSEQVDDEVVDSDESI